jgi:hypothetical protein
MAAPASAILSRILSPARHGFVSLSPELRALTPAAPRWRDLHVRLDDAGRWTIASDSGCTHGAGGPVVLLAALAAVDEPTAAAILAKLALEVAA